MIRHVDAERTILFGPIGRALEELGDGYALLTTDRAARVAPAVVERAASTVHVPAGLVEVVAAGLRAEVAGERLVALGGGRVIDVAKALAASDAPRTVAAIPTSLSGAEMTSVHRHARGVPADTPRVRPRLVVNDPALSASQPAEALAASTANALGHAITAVLSERTTPLARAVALDAVAQLARAWSATDPDRTALALGALLAGWAIDHSGLGPHHALAQTAVRTAGVGHAQANAALLPHTVAAFRRRRPEQLERLDQAAGAPLEAVAERLRTLAGIDGLAAPAPVLERAVETAAGRPELDRIPPAPDRAELRAIYAAAGGMSRNGFSTPTPA